MAGDTGAFIGGDKFLIAGEGGSLVERNAVAQGGPDHGIGGGVFLGDVGPLEIIGAAEIDVLEDAILGGNGEGVRARCHRKIRKRVAK